MRRHWLNGKSTEAEVKDIVRQEAAKAAEKDRKEQESLTKNFNAIAQKLAALQKLPGANFTFTAGPVETVGPGIGIREDNKTDDPKKQRTISTDIPAGQHDTGTLNILVTAKGFTVADGEGYAPETKNAKKAFTRFVQYAALKGRTPQL